jgi:hypothetical protein
MEENEPVGEVHDPGIRVVGWETREDLSGSLVIAKGIVEVLGVAKVLEKIGERDGVGDVEAAHCLFSQTDRPQNTCLEIMSFA